MQQDEIKKDWRYNLHTIIYESDTFWGKVFDIGLLIAILMSVAAVMAESISLYEVNYGILLTRLEWTFTILFTLEYILRIISIKRPLSYILSFYGIVDLLAILPSYFGLFFYDAHSLMTIRLLRLLRVFRILKLSRYLGEANVLWGALKSSAIKISVFLFTVVVSVVIVGTLMFVIEGGKNGFGNIPECVYWAIVTLTTVGYGDIVPFTNLGKVLASVLMILGYGIIAVPTGIVSVELHKASQNPSSQACLVCGKEGHELDAVHCKFCGNPLNPP